MEQIKILLVSDVYKHSTMDVFNGYVTAFKKLCVPFDTFRMVDALESFSPEITASILMSRILASSEKITHVIYVAGTSIQPEIYRTVNKYGIHQSIIATDDPQSSGKIMTLTDQTHLIDSWFTNEKTCLCLPKTFYVPTAAPSVASLLINPKKIYDFCFVGSAYPSRRLVLNEIAEFCTEKNLKAFFGGHFQLIPPEAPLHRYAHQGRIDNNDTLKLYQQSKYVINMERDPHWHPLGHNPYLYPTTKKDPYDSNPRVHEIALTKSCGIHINPRQSVRDQYGEDSFIICDFQNLRETLLLCLTLSDDERNAIGLNAYNKCIMSHTYSHRAIDILRNIGVRLVENNNSNIRRVERVSKNSTRDEFKFIPNEATGDENNVETND